MTAPRTADASAGLPTGLVVPQSPFLGVIPADLANAPNKRPIWVPLNSLAVAAGATGRVRYQADNNQSLVLYVPSLVVRVNADKSIVNDPAVDVQLTDNQGVSYFANDVVDAATMFGTGRNPAILPLPLVLYGGQAINMLFTNRGAATWDMHATLAGFVV